ncbi:Terminase_6 domain-containing protein [Tenacibaculum sp. 190524A02b]|uniref:terminase large subunit domain-containing protein n=1 Tax=Tenacibaculum vairaonense TaxID=3137860 RepID=UPI0032B19AFC
MKRQVKVIQPQQGYQMMALSSSADIVIGGGAAGAGKTFTLLLDPLRSINNPDFGAVIFRRLTTQIKAQGGLWDESNKLYPFVGGIANKTELQWKFPKGAKIKFTHLEHEKNIYGWQGAQIPFIGFDELTHFSKKTFFYLLSRNRSNCGVRPGVRATCNPDPDSWVSELISWWIGDDGFPIPERQGVIRYFVKDGENLIWGDSVDKCLEKASYFVDPLSKASGVSPKSFVKSITFIGGSVYDNKELLSVNPEYLANLASQDEDTRIQLLDGNWKVSVNPADVYNYDSFKDYFTNDWVEKGKKCITVDVAMSGSNKLVVSYFEGDRWEDIEIIAKSSGKDVIDAIKEFQKRYGVSNSKVTYDANGVGAFIGGGDNAFIPNSIPFDNASKAFEMKDGRKFKNLKSQCYYLDGENESQYISSKVANKMYDNKMTVRQRLLFERKAIKKKIKRDEEPFALIPKNEMKEKYLNGESPDLLDSKMMKRIFDVRPKSEIFETKAKSLGDLGINF